jgi:hypothetical protein
MYRESTPVYLEKGPVGPGRVITLTPQAGMT